MNQDFIEIYKSVVDCQSALCAKSGEILNSLESRASGSLPRGFFTEASREVQILVVGKNPGHILASEAALYKDLAAERFIDAHMSFSKEVFRKKLSISGADKKSTTFHSNLFFYLSAILDANAEDVFKLAAYTNLVKCSTIDEQAKIKRRTMSECFGKHLIKEINYFRPKVLLALGREVESHLNFAKSKQLHALDVVYIKHPSYHYKKDMRDKELEKIKSLVLGAMKNTAAAHS